MNYVGRIVHSQGLHLHLYSSLSTQVFTQESPEISTFNVCSLVVVFGKL